MRMFLLLVSLLASAAASESTPVEALADRIVTAVDRPLGLVHLPLGDPALALALAARSPLCVVHLQLADTLAVRQARERIDGSGLLNRRIFIDQGDAQRLLPAGRSCDLVALPQLPVSALTVALAQEVRRILHPWYGVVAIADGPGVGDWLQKVGGAISRRDGLLLATAPALAGADDWGQWWHGADNNCVSADTSFTLPGTMQWTAKPFFSPTRVELPIISAGRLFTLWNGSVMDASAGMPVFSEAPVGNGPVLMAQATGSGVRLWLRRLSAAAWMQVSRSIVIGDGDTVLVGDGHTLLELDAASGRTRRSLEIDTPEIKWMALQGGRLFILGGSLTVSQGNRSDKNLVPFRTSGLHLIALDRKTLAQIWRRDREPGDTAYDPRSPSIAGERLFICGAVNAVECISVSDGKTIWQVETDLGHAPRLKVVDYEWDETSRHPVSGYALGGVYVISGAEMKQAVVLAQDDGRRLWTTSTPGRSQYDPLAIWGLLWRDNQTVDPSSGQPMCKMKVGSLLVGREGNGRDFPLDGPVDVAAAPGVDRGLLKQLRLITAPNIYSVEGLVPGSAVTVGLVLCEPWDDKPGRRLCDVEINGTSALERFDLFTEAHGRNKAMVRNLPAQADDKGQIQMRISSTPGCADANPVLCAIMILRGEEVLAAYPATGTYAPVRGFSPYRGDSCARSTIAPFLETSHYTTAESLKSSCGAGSFVADGLLWKFPSPCAGCFEWRGFLEQSAREQGLPPPPARLQSAAKAPAPPADAAPLRGWPCYRADPQRSAACTAMVAQAAHTAWQVPSDAPVGQQSRRGTVMMDAEYVPTPPLVIGQRVVVARADGTVDAFDLRDGHRLWRAYTAGRIMSSPSAWRDRIFVGSADGQVYAFALADGQELWRLRVAPEASRIMVYDQLGSRWPVLCSPLVVGDTVVASAGLVGMIDGVHVVCADAASGAPRWERDDWSDSESDGRISGGAQLALGNEIFYHGGAAPPIRLDPANGDARPVFPETANRLMQGGSAKWRTAQAFGPVWDGVKGQDIGVLSNQWLLYGGRRMWTDQAEDGTWSFSLTLLGRDPQGHGCLPVIRVPNCGRLPAWDSRDTVFVCDRGLGPSKNLAGIVLIPRDRLLPALEALMTGPSTADILALDAKPPKNSMTVTPDLIARTLTLDSPGLSAWIHPLPYAWQAVSWALCGNALVVVTCADTGPDPGRLMALSRIDGSMLWELHLHVKPVHYALAVAADGSIVVTLVDGQTICVSAGNG
jgi:outer membrane protein assembly factor BamB